MKWIPVSERLPEKDTEVLVWDKDSVDFGDLDAIAGEANRL